MTDEINHELESGDVLIDQLSGDRFKVVDVRDDGSVDVRDMTNRSDGSWTHEEVCRGLVEGTIERKDGKSHELVKSF